MRLSSNLSLFHIFFLLYTFKNAIIFYSQILHKKFKTKLIQQQRLSGSGCYWTGFYSYAVECINDALHQKFAEMLRLSELPPHFIFCCSFSVRLWKSILCKLFILLCSGLKTSFCTREKMMGRLLCYYVTPLTTGIPSDFGVPVVNLWYTNFGPGQIREY